ncbi:unnamed protein product [Soboliphyme baturini]|uniref:RGS domain-containing protein n=1 Tax=Soboliphyme baturini TaxID=241478 RepID=A0A183J3P1_9BILA|nr:unnamed protein product [Soboliphyme baturini]
MGGKKTGVAVDLRRNSGDRRCRHEHGRWSASPKTPALVGCCTPVLEDATVSPYFDTCFKVMSEGCSSGGFRRSRTYYGIPNKRSYVCRNQLANHRSTTGNSSRCSREKCFQRASASPSSAVAVPARTDDDGDTSCSSEEYVFMSHMFASDHSEEPTADSEEERRLQMMKASCSNGSGGSLVPDVECRSGQFCCYANRLTNLPVVKRSLTERVFEMFLSETLADVHFWVGSHENGQVRFVVVSSVVSRFAMCCTLQRRHCLGFRKLLGVK